MVRAVLLTWKISIWFLSSKKKRREGRSEKKGKEGGGDGEGERMRIHNKI